jgi:hypothetical protein
LGVQQSNAGRVPVSSTNLSSHLAKDALRSTSGATCWHRIALGARSWNGMQVIDSCNPQQSVDRLLLSRILPMGVRAPLALLCCFSLWPLLPWCCRCIHRGPPAGMHSSAIELLEDAANSRIAYANNCWHECWLGTVMAIEDHDSVVNRSYLPPKFTDLLPTGLTGWPN